MKRSNVVIAGCSDPDIHPVRCKCFPLACVFCEIARTGEAKDFQRHGDTSVSFTPLRPRVKGHRLFVPSRHSRDFSEDPGHAAAAFYQAGRWAAAQGEDFNLITSGGSNATQTVFHTHIHYVPRRLNDGLKLPWSE